MMGIICVQYVTPLEATYRAGQILTGQKNLKTAKKVWLDLTKECIFAAHVIATGLL